MQGTRRLSIGIILTVLLLGVVALAAIGCGDSATTTTAPPTTAVAGTSATGLTFFDYWTPPAGDAKLSFAECSPVASNQHQMAFTYGKQEMAKLYGADFTVTDANLSSTKQIADLDTFIQKKVNGIVTWTLDQGAATAAYKKCQEAGIPIIGEGSPGDYVTTAFLPGFMNTKEAETDAAKWISSVYPGGKIIVVGGEPVPYIVFVANKMVEEAEAAGLTVLARQDNMTDQANGAQQIVQDLLTKYPDVQAVWCFNDRSALGASAALRAAGKKIYNAAAPEDGAVFVTGMNGTQEAIEAIRAGVMSASYAGDSEKVGAAELEELILIATGQLTKDQIPAIVVTPWHRIDGTTVDSASFPLETKIEKGIFQEFLQDNDPSRADEFMEFLKTL